MTSIRPSGLTSILYLVRAYASYSLLPCFLASPGLHVLGAMPVAGVASTTPNDTEDYGDFYVSEDGEQQRAPPSEVW